MPDWSFMSFSGEVKKELLAHVSPDRHCQLAEIAAMISGAGSIRRRDGRIHISFVTENKSVADKYVRLLSAAAGITACVSRAPHTQQKHKHSYLVSLSEEADVRNLFVLLKIMDSRGTLREQLTLADDRLLQKSCCRRAFLRGAFLTAGSMSNPKKSYHFEIVCESAAKARQIREQFESFALKAKIIQRKSHEIVYLKEGSQIVDALNVMEAHVALMDLENVRIIKEMRNDINRRVNCETANINKTVHAAYRQLEAIRYLRQQGAVKELSAQLQEIIRLRMEYPEAPIQELGTLCRPPVGKSGVNHRLRRLEEIAEQMGYEKKNEPC